MSKTTRREYPDRTTRQHFKIFKKECQVWINRYGLKDWVFQFCHQDTINQPGCCGHSYWNRSARACNITLQKTTWLIPPTAEQIKKTAREEVRHILLGRLELLAKSRFIAEDEIDEEIHAIIQRLENATEE